MRRRCTSQRRDPGSHTAPARWRMCSSSFGQRTATCLPSSANSQGPIYAGRWRSTTYKPLPYPVWLGRCPVARAIMASITTTRTAAAAISTNLGMAQFPRLSAPWPSVDPTTSGCLAKAVWSEAVAPCCPHGRWLWHLYQYRGVLERLRRICHCPITGASAMPGPWSWVTKPKPAG
jgi:hypothetical protein